MSILELCQNHLQEAKPARLSHMSYPTSYGALYGKNIKEFKDQQNQACLGSIGGLPVGKTAFYIWHQAQDTPLNREYLRYIMSPTESPWRRIIQAQPRQDLDFVFQNGFVLTELDFACNFLVNFLTAFRLSYEKPYCLDFWGDLLEAGVRPGTGLMFTSCCAAYDKNHGSFNFISDSGHNAFSLPRADLETVRRVNQGAPNERNFNSSFTKSNQYAPCNIVWTKSGLYEGTPELFNEMYRSKAKIVGRRFGNPQEVASKVPTFQELKSFLLELDQRFPSEKEKEAA